MRASYWKVTYVEVVNPVVNMRLDPHIYNREDKRRDGAF